AGRTQPTRAKIRDSRALTLLGRGGAAHAYDRFLQRVVAERMLDQLAVAAGHGTNHRDQLIAGALERDLRVWCVRRRGGFDGIGSVERSVKRNATHAGARNLLRLVVFT